MCGAGIDVDDESASTRGDRASPPHAALDVRLPRVLGRPGRVGRSCADQSSHRPVPALDGPLRGVRGPRGLHVVPFRPAPRLPLVVAITYVGYVGGGLLYGVAVPQLLYTGAVNLVVGAGAVWFYRLRGIARSWVPRDARETLWLLVTLGAATTVGALLGAFPASGLHPGADPQHVIWAAARSFGGITVTAYCLLPLYFSDSDGLGRGVSVRTALAALPLAIASLAIPLALPGVPLSWLYVLPPVWAALVMPRRGTALYTLLFGVFASFIPYASYPQHYLGGLFTPEAIVDATFAFVSYLAMLIISLRAENLRLQRSATALADTDRSQQELFSSVIQSMADGMIVTDRTGRVTMTNLAADAMATVAIPDRLDMTWVDAFNLQAAAADRAARGVLLRSLLQPEAGITRQVEILLPRADGTLRLAVSSTDLPAGPERLTLLLFRDITLARRRQEELESFAGTVAHDLKGPLTALFGWMEAAGDELADHDPVSGRAALERAHDAVERMRSLIDDYLAHAVSHGGSCASRTSTSPAWSGHRLRVFPDARRPDLRGGRAARPTRGRVADAPAHGQPHRQQRQVRQGGRAGAHRRAQPRRRLGLGGSPGGRPGPRPGAR